MELFPRAEEPWHCLFLRKEKGTRKSRYTAGVSLPSPPQSLSVTGIIMHAAAGGTNQIAEGNRRFAKDKSQCDYTRSFS